MIETTTTSKEQRIEVSYGDHGRNPHVVFSFKGAWSARRDGHWAANGNYEFVLDAGRGRKGHPRKLILEGLVSEDIAPEERGPLARKIKEQLKPQIVALLEQVNGDVKRQVHKMW